MMTWALIRSPDSGQRGARPTERGFGAPPAVPCPLRPKLHLPPPPRRRAARARPSPSRLPGDGDRAQASLPSMVRARGRQAGRGPDSVPSIRPPAFPLKICACSSRSAEGENVEIDFEPVCLGAVHACDIAWCGSCLKAEKPVGPLRGRARGVAVVQPRRENGSIPLTTLTFIWR